MDPRSNRLNLSLHHASLGISRNPFAVAYAVNFHESHKTYVYSNLHIIVMNFHESHQTYVYSNLYIIVKSFVRNIWNIQNSEDINPVQFYSAYDDFLLLTPEALTYNTPKQLKYNIQTSFQRRFFAALSTKTLASSCLVKLLSSPCVK